MVGSRDDARVRDPGYRESGYSLSVSDAESIPQPPARDPAPGAMTAPGHADGEAGLTVERVEVVPSSGGLVHVRVVGAWHGRLLSAPRAVLLAGAGVDQSRLEPIHEPREPVGGWVGPRGEWRATFAVPEHLLAGGASLEFDGHHVPLPGLHPPGRVPEADPGAEPPQAGATILDHPALAERRSRGEASPPEERMPPPSRRATIAGRETMLARGLAGAPGADVPSASAASPPPPFRPPGLAPSGEREDADRVAALRAQVAAAVHGVASDLEAERAARSALEGELVRERDRRAALEAELARRRVLDARLAAGVAAARQALAQAGDALAQAPVGPPPEVRERMEELRTQVEALRERAAGEPETPSGSVDPERLAAALARLRATVAPALETAAERGAGAAVEQHDSDAPSATAPVPAESVPAETEPGEPVPAETVPAVPVAPWLPSALRDLAARDPEAAGRAVVALLPAQGLAVPGDLSYDLAVRRGPTYAVTVRDGATEVLERSSPRPRRERDFAARASLRGLGRWSTGRRRRGVRGRRRAGPLRALAAHPLSLADLDAAGVRPDAGLAWVLVAAAIDPDWTEGNDLSVRHEVVGLERPDAVIIRAGAGAPLRVDAAASGAEDEAADATLRTTPGAVLAALRGAPPPPGEMVEEGGDREAIATLQAWIARAQRGIRPSA